METAVDSPTWVTCRVPHPDAAGLGDLVAEPDAFLADDLFRRAVWTPADTVARLAGRLPTVAALWSDALARHVRTPAFRLVQDGTTLAASSYCRSAGMGQRTIDDVIEPNRVVELHRSGATMVLQGLQLTDPALGRFANNLALALDHPVQINAYLSPAAARGLDLHFDFHDVFVVQLDGCKRWRVWEPLPRTHEPVRGRPAVVMPTLDELGPPALDLTLRPGDCLYLPRGFPHAAETVESASAHLTVGLMAITWQRLAHHAIDAAIAAGHLRGSVPSLSLDGGTTGASLGPAALAPVAAECSVDRVRSWLAREIWRRQPVTRLRPLVAPPVDAARPVVVTPGALLWATTAGSVGARAVLGLGERQLDLPAEPFPFLVALLCAPTGFVAADWDGPLDGTSRQVVLDRLADEGVIVPGPV